MAAINPVSFGPHEGSDNATGSESSLHIPARSVYALMAKRMFDFTTAAVGLILLSPLFVLLALLIKLQDGGPILHRRRVIGIRGSFDAFKFRSMRTDADAVLQTDSMMQQNFQRNFKLKDDPRITPIGAKLRKYSLDELPQLVNVLRGQMSLVGPRMITSAELPKYGKYQQLLVSVKPGLTGYWQVNGRQNVGYSRRVKMDMYYIQNWSLRLDLRIVLKTPLVVLKGNGAL
jgi:lipopolysaccharide/colanic/teichoic acid biosynthesis glycosyltransferase